MSNFSFKSIDVPAAAGTYEYISVDGVDAAGEAVGNYGNVDGEGDGTFHGLIADTSNGTTNDPPGSSNTDIVGITSGGEIFGDYVDFENRQHGFVENNGVVSNVDVLFANSTTVAGVNDAGVIYGEFADNTNAVHGFIDNSGSFTQIDVPGATSTSVSGVNAAGVMVGTFTDSEFAVHGFVESNGNFTTFDPPGSIFTSVVGVSDAGVIVGNYQDSANNQHGFVDNNGVFTTISIPGASSIGVSAINATGEIVGYYADDAGNIHGFVDQGGVITTVDIPGATETNILGVSASGEISGYYNDSSGTQHGFVGTPAITVVNDGPLSVEAGTTQTITSGILSASDNVGSGGLQYTVTTNPADGTLLLNGVATTSFTQADINNGLVSYHETVGGSATSDNFQFIVTDAAGDTTGTESFLINITPPPVLTVTSENVAATAGQSIAASSLFSATDPSGNPLTYYIDDSDTAANGGHFVVDGTVMASGTTFAVTAAQLAQTTFVAGVAGTSDDLYVLAYDGQAASNNGAFSEFQVNVAGTYRPPVLTVTSEHVVATAGQSIAASSLFSATDPNGIPLTYYLDDSDTAANGGHFVVDGTVMASGTTFAVTAAQLAETTFVAGAAGTSDDLYVLAYDGHAASNNGAFSEFQVTAVGPPVLTVTSENVAATAGQSIAASSLFSATDPSGNPLTYYIDDSDTAADGGHFVVNGTVMPSGTTFAVTAAQLAETTFVAGAAGTSDDLYVLAYDGHAASNNGAFSEFQVNVAGTYQPPVLTVTSENVSTTAGEVIAASSLFSATDPSGNPLTYYIDDSDTAANGGHFVVDGTVMASGTTFAVTAAQLAQTTFVAGATGTVDDLYVLAYDGHAASNNGAFSEFQVNVAGTYQPPVLTVTSENVSTTAGEVIAAPSLFSATDPSGNPLTYYIDDSDTAANGGHFVVNGTVMASGTTFAVTAAQLAETTFVAGAAGTSDDLYVLAYDGHAASNNGAFSEFQVNVAGTYQPPVLTVTSEHVSATAGQSIAASSLFSATDPNGIPLTYYIDDSDTAANGGHFVVNGTVMASGTTFAVTAAQLAETTFVAGAAGTSDDLYVLAYDGHAASNNGAFSEFQVTVGGTSHSIAAPVLPNVSVAAPQLPPAPVANLDTLAHPDAAGHMTSGFVHDFHFLI